MGRPKSRFLLPILNEILLTNKMLCKTSRGQAPALQWPGQQLPDSESSQRRALSPDVFYAHAQSESTTSLDNIDLQSIGASSFIE